MIELRNVHKSLGDREILRGMTFSVPQGRTYVLMGRSGCGKSVTLRHIIGILQPDSGSVRVDDHEVPELDPAGLMNLRKRMGYLFQNGALINWLTVAENVALPLEEHTRLSRSQVREKVMEVLELVGMDRAAHQYPARISGGMKLRAGLARALITEPEYVLYDEPNAGLDPIMADQIHRLINRVKERVGVTGLVVTHSRACAFTVGDIIGVIDNGAIIQEGNIETMGASDNELVQQFLGGGAD
ncbi:MAG: ABC transporter ATP-binding protein [Planctomycetota bacterium]|jgi:phospholipid/cholesterol/gamma-HCH transport system ATP-binding protein